MLSQQITYLNCIVITIYFTRIYLEILNSVPGECYMAGNTNARDLTGQYGTFFRTGLGDSLLART